jgi:hypothetical protein
VDEDSDRCNAADEGTHLLPPSGISTNEYADRRHHYNMQRHPASQSGSSNRLRTSDETSELRATSRRDNTTAFAVREFEVRLDYDDSSVPVVALVESHTWFRLYTFLFMNYQQEQAKPSKKKKKKKKKRRSSRKSRQYSAEDTSDSSSYSSTSASPHEHNRFLNSWAFSELDRAGGVDKWYSEGQAETKTNRDSRFWRRLESLRGDLTYKLFTLFAWAESFFANLPLTIGAIALSIANLGCVWFKFAEENMDSCQPVHFHSAQCTFPEVSCIWNAGSILARTISRFSHVHY